MIPKFRAWLKEENKMIEPSDILSISFKLCEMTPNYLHGFEKEKYDFYDLELMQSTGLKDKNGKEIFEGDILKFNDEWPDYCYEGYVDGSIDGINHVEIKREKTYFAFGKTKIPESSLIALVEDEHYPFEELLTEASYEFEIIGNIYENPELLEVE
ncbi:YopX family protein [Streptococcus australis]|uniref:YopX family protein n=1 Tax=Streptococcus australis TaxID=113107 RepID=UPI0039C3255A